MKKSKINEALLVIVTGFLLLYLVYEKDVFLYISFGIGVLSVFIKPLAKWIAIGWFKLGDALGFVVSKVVLGIVFYILLVPIALVYRLFNKDALSLIYQDKSLWNKRNHKYTASDLKNIW